MCQVKTVGIKIKMLGNVRFDLSFDFDIGLEILAGKKVREGLVDINKMLPL